MSVNPTEYDVIQDEQIDELKEIVSTTYQAPDQVEYSYPIVDQPMNDEQWQYITLAIGSGIMDEGGRPYWLKLNGSEANTNSTNTMLLTVSSVTKTAQAIVRGFYHRLLQDMQLVFPGVTATTTYYVVLHYDPTRHKEPSGPISIKVETALAKNGGKFNVLLWSLTRQPSQLLSDATIKTFRPKACPQITVDTYDALPDPATCLWGTQAFVENEDANYRAYGSSEEAGGPTTWRPITDPAWIEYPDTPTYRWPGHGHRRAIQRKGKSRRLRGRIAAVDGTDFQPTSTGALAFTLAEQDRPRNGQRVPIAMSGYNPPRVGLANIATNGEVRVFPPAGVPWIGLDGIKFDVE